MAPATLICPERCVLTLGSNITEAGMIAGRVALGHAQKTGHEGTFLLSLRPSKTVRSLMHDEFWLIPVEDNQVQEGRPAREVNLTSWLGEVVER